MKRLNKLERYTAYCILHEEAKYVRDRRFNGYVVEYFKWGTVGGMCDLLANIIEDDSMDNPLKEFNLIELISKKPEKGYLYWFSTDFTGWDKRIKLLEKCIEETHP